jgi:glycosyltransferase involved in cell wall biosynthesis
VKLGIDATSVAPDGKGIARVQRGIVEALAAQGEHELVVFVRHREALELFAAHPLTCELVRPPLTLWWEQHGLATAARRHGVDATLTWTERLPQFAPARRRFLVWLYEVPHHRIAHNRATGAARYQRASDLVTRLVWRRSLRRAAWVFTGSAATEAELLALAPELRGKTQPLLAAVDPSFVPGAGPHAPAYLFHLGSSDPRDNTETVLDAYALLEDAPPLVVAGGLGARRAELEARAPAGTQFRGRVSDAELVALYQGATAFVDASLYEGFGYQALEAMSCGAPVVASDATSIPEVVGDAGILCEPTDAAAFADGLRRILADPALAADLRARGLARAATFTWERAARELSARLASVVRVA